MRTLPLIDSNGQIDHCALGVLQAAMQFPDDPDSMEEDIAAYRMRAASGFRNTGLGKHLQDTWRAAQMGGLCAGSMLYTMLMFEKHQPEMQVGMNKSAVATALELRKFGKQFAKNESTIKKYWAEYKNAAHLWTALILEWNENGQSFNPPLSVLGILNKGDSIRQLAAPLIADWSPWRAPPQLIDGSQVEIRAPDADDIALVRKYRADGRYPA